MNFNEAREFISLIKTIIRQENRKDNLVRFYIGKVVTANADKTFNISLYNDSTSVIKNIKNNSKFSIVVGDTVGVIQFGNSKNNSFIIDKNGTIL